MMKHAARFVLAALLILLNPWAHAASDNEVRVSLSKAQICFTGQCFPALVGEQTRVGVFPLLHARVVAPGYGGDVLAFDTDRDGVPLAIHRVWVLNLKQRRLERLAGPVAGRVGITGGCINVMPEVYAMIVDCCSKGRVTIEP